MTNSFKHKEVFIIIVLLSLFFSVGVLFSQPMNSIAGIVLDKETGEPIPTVHVYISQTTIGTTTKHDGTFEFSTKLAGMHTLVVSYVGYKTETKEINFYTDQKLYFEVELTPDPIELAPLEVTASNKDWQRNFKIFRDNFIGLTNAAENTEIENPWIIDFELDDKENLVATANRPLTIYNYTLGYEIRVDLVEFNWPKNGEPGYYLFHSSYSEIEPVNGRQKKRWEMNRRNTYLGSFEHFLKSLYQNSLKENNFDVVVPNTHNIVKLDPMDSISSAGLRMHANITGLSSKNVKAYRLRSPVDVLYGNRWFNRDRVRSRITPEAMGGIFVVTDQARLANPLALKLGGPWSIHRLADLLPTDYNLNE